MSTLPFVEKYRPTCLQDVVLEPLNRTLFNHVLETGKFPNFLCYGPPGNGKTSSIINLIQEFKKRHHLGHGSTLHLNASDDRGIDVLRFQILPFIKSTPMFECPLKFVILDEVDYMTKNAQQALKFLLQTSPENVRFCLICNYSSRIEPSLLNELVCVRFNQLPKEEVITFLEHISDTESLGLSIDDLESIRETYGTDVRSMINFLQLRLSDQGQKLFNKNNLLELRKEWSAGHKQWELCVTIQSRRFNMDRREIQYRFYDYMTRQLMEEGGDVHSFLNEIRPTAIPSTST